MSTILKALRRLEQEKQAGGDRPLREEVVSSAPEPDAPRSRRRTFAVLGVLWVLTVAVVVWTQWSAFDRELAELRDVAAAPDAGAEAQPPSAPAPDRAAAPPPRALPEPAPPPVAEPDDVIGALPDEAFASQVEVVRRPPVSPRRPIEIARASDPMPAPDAEPAPAPKVAPGPAPEPVPVAKAPAPEPAPTPKPAPAEPVRVAKTEPPAPEATPAPEPEPAPAAEAAPPPPAASDLAVEKTLWHPSVSRRAAYVALGGGPAARVEEGDTVGRYSVLEIKPTGVVFLRDGRELTLQVGARP